MSARAPDSHDLLPCTDVEWNQGSIGSNEPLLAGSFHTGTSLGPFAQTCQAAYMLDKVMTHLDRCRRSDDQNVTEMLADAMQLHRALLALDASLNLPGMLSTHSYPSTDTRSHIQDQGGQNQCAIALCCSARTLLYDEYGCNEPDARIINRERIAMETEAQRVAFRGVEVMAAMTIPRMARLVVQTSAAALVMPSISPLLGYCLYLGATECAWFIRENHERNMYAALRQIIQGLRVLNAQWRVGGKHHRCLDPVDYMLTRLLRKGEYLALLEKSSVLNLVDDGEAVAD